MARVLVIDDDEAIRRTLLRLLRAEGHTVVEAANGKDALERFSGDPTDLILSDIYMPEMDGIELLKRTRDAFPRASFVAMSGGGTLPAPYLLAAAKALGATAVLQKPFDMDALREHIPGPSGNDGA